MDKKELAFELEMAMAAQSWCMVRKVIATLKSEDALRESEELRRDAERLDALEALLNEQPDGMLLLHHGAGAGRGIVGLGLRNTNRTLRAAIDSARGVER